MTGRLILNHFGCVFISQTQKLVVIFAGFLKFSDHVWDLLHLLLLRLLKHVLHWIRKCQVNALILLRLFKYRILIRNVYILTTIFGAVAWYNRRVWVTFVMDFSWELLYHFVKISWLKLQQLSLLRVFKEFAFYSILLLIFIVDQVYFESIYLLRQLLWLGSLASKDYLAILGRGLHLIRNLIFFNSCHFWKVLSLILTLQPLGSNRA